MRVDFRLVGDILTIQVTQNGRQVSWAHPIFVGRLHDIRTALQSIDGYHFVTTDGAHDLLIHFNTDDAATRGCSRALECIRDSLKMIN